MSQKPVRAKETTMKTMTYRSRYQAAVYAALAVLVVSLTSLMVNAGIHTQVLA
jgi:hypothetical protein